MKKVLLIVLALLTLGSTLVVNAQKKEKKEKKELKWEWDGTKSGNETIDKYLLTIDTLYNRVISYRDSIDSFEYRDTVINIKGKDYKVAYMLNHEGQLVTQGQINSQFMEATLDGMNLVLDMTSAGLESATAALALPQLGLNALKFAKYVKGGPAVISQGIKTVKTIRGKWQSNLRDWRGTKTSALTKEQVASLGYFSDEWIKKYYKCIRISPVDSQSEKYIAYQETQKDKTEEEKAKDAEGWVKDIEGREVAQAKTREENENITDEDFEKMMKDA